MCYTWEIIPGELFLKCNTSGWLLLVVEHQLYPRDRDISTMTEIHWDVLHLRDYPGGIILKCNTSGWLLLVVERRLYPRDRDISTMTEIQCDVLHLRDYPGNYS